MRIAINGLTLARTMTDASADWLWLNPDDADTRPGAFCAFAFDPLDPMADEWKGFPNAALFFPELLVERRGSECHASVEGSSRWLAEKLNRVPISGSCLRNCWTIKL